jgi:undecaprenyl-diphosphatase
VNALIRLVADFALYAVALGAVVAWLRGPRTEKLPFALAAVIAAAAVGVLVKVAGLIWVDPRPFVVDHTVPLIAHNADNGFPSDHTALATGIALVVVWWHRRFGLALVALAVLLGAARVAAHVHHVPDILGGLAAGLLAAAAAVTLAPWLATRIGARRTDTSPQPAE